MLDAAIAGHRLSGEMYGGVWSDVGTPERLAALRGSGRAAAAQPVTYRYPFDVSPCHAAFCDCAVYPFCRFCPLGAEVEQVLNEGADWVHFDVMDNHYVPNLTIGPMVCKALRDFGISAPIDVHLMVEPVDALIRMFADAGASVISFHPDASTHVDRSLQLIRDAGRQAPGV